jgi:hypothetical protein
MRGILTYPDYFSNVLTVGTTERGLNFGLYTAKTSLEAEKIKILMASIVKGLGFRGLITLKQIHSGLVHFIDNINYKEYLNNSFIEGDGIFTDSKELLLGILTADCIPVFYTDDSADIAGIVHAGWKGIKNKIHINIIDRIREKLNIRPESLHILIGPHIRNCCYEVKKDLIEELGTINFTTRKSSLFLDIEACLTEDLIKKGIKSENIIKYLKCTKCSEYPHFYSYRGGDMRERMLSFIGIGRPATF